ncbi:MAG: sodium:proton antiporter [Actinobacteria bacterium]|nr:sodium:proton antiporter [Actinomycetota bacterium]
MTLELVAIVGVVVVVAVTALAPRLGVAAPLLLVALGLAASLLPFIDRVTVPPELILGGVLPPLLYSAAVNTPTMEFRRDFRLISTFSVVLVVVSAVTIGVIATWLVPGLPIGIGVALGAIISPTDAVATSIVRQAGVAPRLVTVLDGESMLNDASALVLLRSAVAAVGVSISVWQVGLDFLWAVVAAVVIGFLVGKLHLAVRSRITQVSSNVALSLVVPFIAYVPAEELGASGLVAAVTAGIVTGYGAPRSMGAQDRLAERAVWRTVELLLESAVFLLVGLEARTLADDLIEQGGSLGLAIVVAVVTATLAIAIRAGFVAWSVWLLARRNRRTSAVREKLTQLQDKLADGQVPTAADRRGASTGRARRKVRRLEREANAGGASTEARIGRWQQVVERRLADIDYLAAEQFGWREGVILVWAGMRGAVTIAASQTLPADTPHRSLLVLSATLVAVGSLLIQGLTLGSVAKVLGLNARGGDSDPVKWAELQAELRSAAMTRLADKLDAYPSELVEQLKTRLTRTPDAEDDFRPDTAAAGERMATFRQLRLDMIAVQRDELLALRDVGTYPSAMLSAALTQLDAEQLGIEMHHV